MRHQSKETIQVTIHSSGNQPVYQLLLKLLLKQI